MTGEANECRDVEWRPMEKLFQGILDPSYHPETNHPMLFSIFEVACSAVLDFGVFQTDYFGSLTTSP